MRFDCYQSEGMEGMNDFMSLFSFFKGCGFSIAEQKLISEIYPVIKGKIEDFLTGINKWPRYDGRKFESLCTDREKMLSYKEKIDRIVQILDSSDEKGEKFLQYFPIWKTLREENIEKLLIIKSDLRDIREKTKIAKIGTSLVSFGGGLTIAASLVFPPAAPFAVAGVIAAVSGAFGTAGTNLTELVLTQGSLDEAKNIISNDRKLLQHLGIFEFLDELNDAVDKLFGKSPSSKILNDLIEFLRKIPHILNDVQPHLPALISCLNKLLPTVSEFLVIGPPLAAIILSISFAVFITRRRGCAFLNNNAALGLVSAVDTTVEITSLIAAAGLKSSSTLVDLIPRQLAGNFAAGATAGVGITLDVATIVLNTVELAKGTLADEEKMLCAVANQLKAHLAVCQDLYNELQILRKRRKRRILEWLLYVTAASILTVGLYIKIFG